MKPQDVYAKKYTPQLKGVSFANYKAGTQKSRY